MPLRECYLEKRRTEAACLDGSSLIGGSFRRGSLHTTRTCSQQSSRRPRPCIISRVHVGSSARFSAFHYFLYISMRNTTNTPQLLIKQVMNKFLPANRSFFCKSSLSGLLFLGPIQSVSTARRIAANAGIQVTSSVFDYGVIPHLTSCPSAPPITRQFPKECR